MIKKILMKLFVVLVSAFSLVYIFMQMQNIFVYEIETEYTAINTVEEKDSLVGYIVRNEKIVYAPQTGVFNYIISEGDRLAKGQRIANIYSTSTDLKIQERINAINQKIGVLKNSVVDKNYLTTDITKVDENIAGIFSDIQTAKNNSDYSLIIQNNDDFLVSLNKRQLIVNSINNFDEQIITLESERERLTNSLLGMAGYISSPTSGFFTSEIDGYENVLTLKALQDLSVDNFFTLINSKSNEQSDLTAGKIITDFNWYCLCVTDKTFAADFEAGSTYTLVFPYSLDKRIKADLDKKVVQTNRDEVILVFKTNSIPEGFNFLREQTVEVIKNTYTGLQIKKSALRIIDGVEGVYILSGNTVKFKRVERIFENEGYYFVKIKTSADQDFASSLSLYDAVIVEGKDLFEGKILE